MQTKPKKSLKTFFQLQRTITKQMVQFKSILSPQTTKSLKPSYSGTYYIQRSESTGFEFTSIHLYRMLLTAKICFQATQPLMERPSFGPKMSLKPGYRIEEESDQKQHFSIFFPEYVIELTYSASTTPSLAFMAGGGGSVAEKVVKLTDICGRSIFIKGENSASTLDLWHYVYNKGVQMKLPGYLRRREVPKMTENGNFFEIEFKDSGNAEDYGIEMVALEDAEGVQEACFSWLFDLNVDQVEFAKFERTCLVMLIDGYLVLSRQRLPKFMPSDYLMSPKSVKLDPEFFLAKIEKISLILRNLSLRGVDVAPGFDFAQIGVKDGFIFIKNRKNFSLGVIDKESSFREFSGKLAELFEPLVLEKGPKRGPGSSRAKRCLQNIKILLKANNSFQRGSIQTFKELMYELRENMVLGRARKRSKVGNRKLSSEEDSGRDLSNKGGLDSSGRVDAINTLDGLLQTTKKVNFSVFESGLKCAENVSSMAAGGSREAGLGSKIKFGGRERLMKFKNKFV